MSSSDQQETPQGEAHLDGDEFGDLMVLGRGRPLTGTEQWPVHDLVAQIARSRPADAAVHSGASTTSYGELDAWAGHIAAQLVAAGVGRADHVGVLVEPSTAMVAAALGVLRSGAAYVPVDLAQPDQRIAEILADARVGAVVASDTAKARLARSSPPVVVVGDAPAARGRDDPSAAVPVAATDPAYLIYTSGSTGEPKGVLVEHGQLAASTMARRAVYPGAPVFLLVSPLAFDSSVAGLWGTLTCGGSLVVATSDEVRDPERLVELVDSRQVTHLLCVPSLYTVLLDAADRLGRARLGSLDTVIVAGDSLPEALVARHFASHSRPVALVNEYGPTETTVWASYRRFDVPGPVSIGGAVPGARLYVLDDSLRPVPRGVDGELYIGGAGVSRGYFGRPDATATAFLDDPFAGTPGARMYRTGDLVRWNDEGMLDFLGRRDHQVKIRGHRVELGAVEAVLRAAPGVRDAVAVANAARTQLVGFVVGAGDLVPELVREHAARHLAPTVVPSRIEVLDALPLTLTGKVDRARLRAAAENRQDPPAPPAAGRGEEGDTIAKVSAAWAEVLKRPDIPTEVNFFDLGGHSLTMFQLQDALECHTGTRPSVVALFRHTTVAAQSALIQGDGADADEARAGMRQASARRALAMRARRQRAEREAAQ